MPSIRGIMVIDTIGPVLDVMAISVAANVMEAMYTGAQEIETYARFNAPWSDQTGAARNGLTADVFEESGEIVLELAHSVEYGVWLELIQDGAYAIIMPTLEAMGPKVIRDAGGRVTSIQGVF